MIKALIAHFQERLGALMNERHVDDHSGLEAVLTYVDVFLTALERDRELRAYFVLLAAWVADVSDLRAPSAPAHKEVEQTLESLLPKGKTEGSVRPDVDVDAAALMTGALLFGLAMQLLLDTNMMLEPIRATSLATLRLSFAA